MHRVLLLSTMSVVAASAQALSVGVIGGAPFQDVVTNGTANSVRSIANSTNFTIGPVVQVNLPLNLRLEVDALYRPYDFQLSFSGVTEALSGQQWRFPILAQYRFKAPLIQPYVEGGISFDRLSGLSSAVKSAINSGPGQFLRSSNEGVVLGLGADFKIPLVRVSAELRYTREAQSNFANFSNLNQAEFLVGIHF